MYRCLLHVLSISLSSQLRYIEFCDVSWPMVHHWKQKLMSPTTCHSGALNYKKSPRAHQKTNESRQETGFQYRSPVLDCIWEQGMCKYKDCFQIYICFLYCPACRTTLVATRFRVAVICPIIQVPHCIRVFLYFVWFVFINHIFQFYYELCTYCNILDFYLS